jgi:hypothetical protein
VIDVIDILRGVDAPLTEHWTIGDMANLIAGGRPQALPSVGRG